LIKGDIRDIVKEKAKLEEAQRGMRKKEAAEGTEWEPKFFSSIGNEDPVFRKHAAVTSWQLHAVRTKGVWRFDQEKAAKATKPYWRSHTIRMNETRI